MNVAARSAIRTRPRHWRIASGALALIAAILVPSLAAFAADNAPNIATISIDELRPGMTGYGLTVVKGSSPERFGVEVLGVVRGIAPGRNGILIRASGLGVEQSGIVAGMSGSPVYVDGRLAGAVAFGWPWPQEPICGVTPIADMERAFAAPAALSEPSPSWQDFDFSRLVDPSRPLSSFLPAPVTPAPRTYDGVADLALPLVTPALSAETRRILEEFLPPGRFILAEGVAATASGNEAPSSMVPGGSLFAALVTGDMTVGAVGTVTDVRGNDVYGFGHPFVNNDSIAIPMYTAEILAIFPSRFRSFKIAVPARPVGAITRDRATGILGTLGAEPRTVPVAVTVHDRSGARTFNYRVVDHYSMTANLASTVAAASLTTLGDLPPDSTLSYRFAVSFAGGRDYSLQWTSAGRDALASMARDVSTVLSTAMFNPIERLDPSAISVDVTINPSDASAVIDSAVVRENVVHPGDAIHVSVTLRPALSRPVSVSLELVVPSSTPPGQKSLIVCDGRASDALDREEARNRLSPPDVGALLQLLTPKSSPGDLVARLADAGRGLAFDNLELPNLPASNLAVLAAPQSGSLSAVATSVSARIPTSHVLTGKVIIPVNIVERPE